MNFELSVEQKMVQKAEASVGLVPPLAVEVQGDRNVGFAGLAMDVSLAGCTLGIDTWVFRRVLSREYVSNASEEGLVLVRTTDGDANRIG